MRTIEIPEVKNLDDTIRRPAWSARLRENDEIKVRHRRLIENAGIAAARPMAKIEQQKREGKDVGGLDMTELDLDAVEADRVMALQDAVIVATLASWTLDEPLPTLETVGDMDTDVYEALAKATREQGAAIATSVDFEPKPDDPGFEQSPTSPSGGSEEPLRDEQEHDSLSAPASNGESTPIAVPSD